MAFYTTYDFIREADEQIRLYDEQWQRFTQLLADTNAKANDLRTRLQDAYQSLGESLLPELTDAAFRALADRFGVPELMRLFQRGLAESQRLEARIAEIEQSPAYLNREQRLYELEKQRSEVEPVYRHARQDFDYLNSFPRMRELVARQYGTPHYPHRSWLRFFNGEFLADWKQADTICEKLNVATFPEVAERWREREEQVQILGRSVTELQQEVNALQQLVQERYQSQQNLAQLPAILQQNAGQILAAILKNTDLTALPNPETLKNRILTVDGMEHQIRYLEDLGQKIQQDQRQLEERREKLRMERERYAGNPHRFRNKRFTSEQFDKRFNRQRVTRYQVLHNRYHRAVDTVYVFDDYYRASPLEEFLWWDVMTDGRLDGNFIPEVQEYYAMHPGYAYERPDYYDRDDSMTSGGFDVFDSSSVGES